MPHVVETVLTPRGPYSLARSAAAGSCPTRRFRGGVLELAVDVAAAPARAVVVQRRDGDLTVRMEASDPDAALDLLRRHLAVDVDLTDFYRTVADDPLMGPMTRRLRGMRPLPLLAPAHALLRGVCGQLVRQRDARRVEFAAARAVGRPLGDLHLPLTTPEVRRLPIALLMSAGLAERRAVALVRVLRSLDPDVLASLPTPEVVARLCRAPGIGPWTAGVVCVDGLGRLDHGLVGDLGLMRVMAAAAGRVVAVDETAALLDRYAPYQALASAYLLAGSPVARTPATPAGVARAVRGTRRTGR